MPKRVDHEARRTQIAEALLRLASEGGLEAVTLRDVATEAGLSVGAVQHYFNSKDAMLLHALDHVNRRAEQRIRHRLEEMPQPSPREVLRALMLEMLALTEESRQEFLTFVAFTLRAVNSAELAASYRKFWPELEKLVSDLLRSAREAGALVRDVDPEREAEILLAVPDGLSVGLLLGHRSRQQAIDTVDYYLDGLFGQPDQPERS